MTPNRTCKVKAVAGRLVVNPETGKSLGEEAIVVPMSSYWRNRLRTGDVTMVTDDAKAATPIRQTEPPLVPTEMAAPTSSRKSK